MEAVAARAVREQEAADAAARRAAGAVAAEVLAEALLVQADQALVERARRLALVPHARRRASKRQEQEERQQARLEEEMRVREHQRVTAAIQRRKEQEQEQERAKALEKERAEAMGKKEKKGSKGEKKGKKKKKKKKEEAAQEEEPPNLEVEWLARHPALEAGWRAVRVAARRGSPPPPCPPLSPPRTFSQRLRLLEGGLPPPPPPPHPPPPPVEALEEGAEALDKVLERAAARELEARGTDAYYEREMLKREPVSSFPSSVTSHLSLSDEGRHIFDRTAEFAAIPETLRSRTLWRCQAQLQRAQGRQQMREALERRLRGLQELQRHHEATRAAAQCHREERCRQAAERRKRLERRLRQALPLSEDEFAAVKHELVARAENTKRERQRRERWGLERRISILQRLLAEQRQKEQANLKAQRQRQMPKPTSLKPAFKRSSNFRYMRKEVEMIVQTALEYEDAQICRELGSVDDKSDPFTFATEEIEEEEEEEEELEENTESAKRKRKAKGSKKGKGKEVAGLAKKEGKKGKGNVKEKKGKQKEKKGEKKGKKKKRGAKADESEGESPARSPERLRVEPQALLVEEWNEIDKWTEEIDAIEEAIEKTKETYKKAKELRFSWKPNVVQFKNFQIGNNYRQKVTVTNTSPSWCYCSFEKIELDDPLQITTFELNDMFCGKVYPGLSFDFIVTFIPLPTTKEVFGEIWFATSYREMPEPTYFSIPIHCIDKELEFPVPKVVPQLIKFNNVPEWRKPVKKIMKLVNCGNAPCVASIRKVIDSQKEEIPNDTWDGPKMKEFEGESIENEGEHFDEDAVKRDSKPKIGLEKKRSEKVKSKKEDNLKKSRKLKRGKRSVALREEDFIEEEGEEEKGEGSDKSDPAFEAQNFISQCVDRIFDSFHFGSMHYIAMPPQTCTPVEISFGKLLPGTYSEDYVIKFQDEKQQHISQATVSLLGNIVPFPLTVDPAAINFDICLFDGGIYQTQFTVRSSSNTAVALRSKVPPGLETHVQIVPLQTYIQPHSSTTFTVKLMAKYDIEITGKDYYDKDTEVLEFPAAVQPIHKPFGRCPPLTVLIFAVMASPHALQLSPAHCNLGTVSTLETVCKEITLENTSNARLDYMFTKTPEVHPNYGLGSIGSGETKKLHLLYSPKSVDIEGNAFLKRCGISGEHRFEVKVTSTAAQGGTGDGPKKALEYARIREYVDEMLDAAFGYCTRQPESDTEDVSNKDESSAESKQGDIVSETPSAESKGHSPSPDAKKNSRRSTEASPNEKDTPKASKNGSFLDKKFSGSVLSRCMDESIGGERAEEDTTRSSLAIEEIYKEDKRVLKNMISFEAFIVDPICELSVTKVTLLPTPCGSYSVFDFCIRGINRSSQMECKCATAKPMEPLHAWYQFQSDDEQLSVEPSCGTFMTGENVQATLVFKPVLPRQSVQMQAQRLKAQWMVEKEQQRKAQLEKIASEASTKKKKGKGKKKTGKKKSETKGSSSELLTKDSKEKSGKSSAGDESEEEGESGFLRPETVEVNPEDLFPAEKSLLESLEPYCVSVIVKCVIETAPNNLEGTPRRPEVHRMQVTCPVTKPNFLLRCGTQILDVGLVATGTKTRTTLKVHNITMDTIPVSVSLLNPLGPFFCPVSSVPIAPEHILVLPITFAPTETNPEETSEYFEIRSGSTVMPLTVKGTSVKPEYKISPEFAVYRFDLQKKQGSQEFTVQIENLCAAALPFLAIREFIKQADIQTPQPPGSEATEESKKSSAKNKSSKSAKNKSSKSAKNKSSKSAKNKSSKSAEKKSSKSAEKKSSKSAEKKSSKSAEKKSSKSGVKKSSKSGVKKSSKSGVKKGSKSGDKTQKIQKKQIDVALDPEEAEALQNKFKATISPDDEPIFSMLGGGGEEELVIQPSEKGFFNVTFHPPSLEETKDDERSERDLLDSTSTAGKENSRARKEENMKKNKGGDRSKSKESSTLGSGKREKSDKKPKSKTESKERDRSRDPTSSGSRKRGKSDKKHKGTSKKGSKDEEPKVIYAAKFSLFLGKTTKVKEYIFMANPNDRIMQGGKTGKKKTKK